MGKVLGLLGQFIAYCAIGTVLFELLAVGWLATRGHLNHDTMMKMLALAQGIDTQLVAHDPAEPDEPEEQPSVEDLALAMAVESDQIKRREQELRQGLERWTMALEKLKRERADLDALKAAFFQKLKETREEAANSGLTAVAATLESSRAREAKRQLQLMIKEGEINQAVAMFEKMPVRSRANIAAEFKTEEEAKQLYDIYRLMREGVPETTLVDQTQDELDALGGQ